MRRGIFDELETIIVSQSREIAELERRIYNLERRMREPSPEVSRVSVHISGITPNRPIEYIRDEFDKVYGSVVSVHANERWANIEFNSSEAQRKCLDDAQLLYEKWGITVKPRSLKRHKK